MRTEAAKDHYLTLDGLRGLAAMAVLLFHRRWNMPSGHFLDHAYLAVDFFFGLSGFVVAHAYQAKLCTGSMRFVDFVAVRAIRLYPMLLLGGFLAGAGWLISGHRDVSVYVATLCTMVALPAPMPVYLNEGSSLNAFPINGPIWSLFFEMVVNVIYASVARFLNVRSLLTIIAISLGWLLYSILSSTAAPGIYYSNFLGGVPRTAFSFFVGVLIFELREVIPRVRIHPILLAMALLGVFSPNKGWPVGDTSYLVFCIVLVFPAIIVAGYQNAPKKRLSEYAALAGALSYPIYLLHYPFYVWYEEVSPLPHRPSIVAAALIVPPLSYLVLKIYDEPIRLALGRLARGARSRPGVQREHTSPENRQLKDRA
jgi:peptidoglycan/LPS O-acetylase OafA/YrhL